MLLVWWGVIFTLSPWIRVSCSISPRICREVHDTVQWVSWQWRMLPLARFTSHRPDHSKDTRVFARTAYFQWIQFSPAGSKLSPSSIQPVVKQRARKASDENKCHCMGSKSAICRSTESMMRAPEQRINGHSDGILQKSLFIDSNLTRMRKEGPRER